MIRCFFWLIASCCSLFLFAQPNNDLPTITDVVTEFYSSYTVQNLDYPHVFFEKRPEGWFVLTKKVGKNSLEDGQRYIFYDPKRRAYQDLNFVKASQPVSDISQVVSPYDIQWFELYPYYGYRGWYKDVIQTLEKQLVPSDTCLYLLARAYSTYASSLLSDQLGYSIPSESFKPPLKLNCLTASQIKKYDSLSKKAISLFKLITDRNPNFKTIVGDIAVKYANEVMSRFNELTAYSTAYAKNIKLPDGLYPDSSLQHIRLWMNSCSKNAVFLSFGDNDYYPFLYLQQHDGLRKDIHLLNYNLLGVSRYIYAATQALSGSRPIVLAADPSLYVEGRNEYIYIDDVAKSYPLAEVLSSMKKQSPFELPGNTISISMGKHQAGSKVDLTVGGSYVFKNQWVLLAIIDQLNGREIDFPGGFDDQLKNLNGFLHAHGTVFRLEKF